MVWLFTSTARLLGDSNDKNFPNDIIWTRSCAPRCVDASAGAMCDAGYVGFTRRHLHQRVEEPKNILWPLRISTRILKF